MPANPNPPCHQFFFFSAKTISLKPLCLSFSSLLTWSLHLWIKPTSSMAGAPKLNTGHHHHCLKPSSLPLFLFSPRPISPSLNQTQDLHGWSFKAQHKPPTPLSWLKLHNSTTIRPALFLFIVKKFSFQE